MTLFIAIVTWIVFGFVVGLVSRALVPGNQRMTFWATTALGIIGSVVGAFLLSAVLHQDLDHLHPAGFVGSVLGAALFLAASMGWRRVEL